MSLRWFGYEFEVSADGFETATTDVVPVGTSTLLIELKPLGNARDEPTAKAPSKTIFGTVVHNGKPVANAKIGLQAGRRWYDWLPIRGPFVATALTGDDGQYRNSKPSI